MRVKQVRKTKHIQIENNQKLSSPNILLSLLALLFYQIMSGNLRPTRETATSENRKISIE